MNLVIRPNPSKGRYDPVLPSIVPRTPYFVHESYRTDYTRPSSFFCHAALASLFFPSFLIFSLHTSSMDSARYRCCIACASLSVRERRQIVPCSRCSRPIDQSSSCSRPRFPASCPPPLHIHSNVFHGICPNLLSLSSLPSPSFTPPDRITLGSTASVSLTVWCVLTLASYRMTK